MPPSTTNSSTASYKSDMSFSTDSSSDIDNLLTSKQSRADLSTGVGLSDPHLSGGRRRLLDKVNGLHSTGVQIDIDLPVIAVIGSQSAGKSSLIESISGITLPRASGTCTRCPTECRLAYSKQPWRCIVSLRFTTDATGAALGQARSERFGPPIFDKAEVEERIRRAQRAILNPDTHFQSFLDGDDEDPKERQLTFSKNTVCLEVSSEDVADLSFVDLPGIIAHEGSSGKPGDVELVESLIKTYVVRPSCLILLTVSCETDFENQGAFRLAQNEDPEGKRTIGVLTKPDRIPSGEEDEWVRFIKNERVPLLNGWFAVKQPDSKSLKAGMTWAKARDSENAFFSTHLPWANLESDYQKRLKTANLTACLSQILSELITKRLPEIQQELQAILQRTQADIRALPKPPSDDPVGEIHQLLDGFTRDVSTHVKGVPRVDGLIQRIKAHQKTFRANIRKTAPDFRPYNSDEEDEPDMPTPDFLGAEDPPDHIAGQAQYIDEICDRLEEARTRELPGHFPFVVIENFVKEITDQWVAPAQDYVDEVHDIVANYVSDLIRERFGSHAAGGLQQHVAVIANEYIRSRAEETHKRVDWLLCLERLPFTLNTHYYDDYKDKFLGYFKAVYDEHHDRGMVTNLHTFHAGDAPEELQHAMASVMSGLQALGLPSVAYGDLTKLLPPTGSHDEHALEVMAQVRAYYQVAYKRVSDNIPLAVDREMLLELDENIGMQLFKGLGLGGENSADMCRELLAEPRNTAARRIELQKKFDRLTTAKRELMSISIS